MPRAICTARPSSVARLEQALFSSSRTRRPRAWTETILYNFAGGNDGSQPWGGLIFDSAGNLYGTTYLGGTSNAGTVYELTPGKGGAWTETVLYSFAGGADGTGPQSDLNFDQAGNLYGTTTGGGSPGNGIVFQLTPGKVVRGPKLSSTVSWPAKAPVPEPP